MEKYFLNSLDLYFTASEGGFCSNMFVKVMIISHQVDHMQDIRATYKQMYQEK